MVANLKKAVIIYGAKTLSDAEITFVASHFDLLLCSFGMSPTVLQSLKMANPNMIILGYCNIIAIAFSGWEAQKAAYTSDEINTINANENWFLHDLNGNRIINPTYPWYMMDITSGWKQFYSSHVNSRLSNSLFDGVFADDVWVELSLYVRWGLIADAVTGITLTMSDISSSVLSNWHSNMVSMLQDVKNNIISGKKVVVNTYESLDDPSSENHDYAYATDGRMAEGFVHKWDWELTDFQESWFPPLRYINEMITESSTGKIFFVENSAQVPVNPDSATLALIDQNVKYCYVATLLGMNGPNCYFCYLGWFGNDGARGYYPIMDTNVGNPKGTYYQVHPEAYGRDFDHAKVFINFSSTQTYEVTVNEVVYTLPPHSGIIAPWEAAPTPTPSIVLPTIVILALTCIGAIYVLSTKK